MMSEATYGPAPLPEWRDVEGSVVDSDELQADDVEIDLTEGRAVVRRLQYPHIDHLWARQWPTWIGLSPARD